MPLHAMWGGVEYNMKRFLIEYKIGIETKYEEYYTEDYYFTNHDVANVFLRTHDSDFRIVRIWIDSGAW